MASPFLWNIFVNKLLSKLEKLKVRACAFTDDIVLVSNNDVNLIKGITFLKKWAAARNLAVNNSKSGIIYMRQQMSYASYQSMPTAICGIPVVTSYKWLGITIDNFLEGTVESSTLNALNVRFGHLLD